MAAKVILGCAYCEREDVAVSLCCRHHVRQVCGDCMDGPAFLADHAVAKAS